MAKHQQARLEQPEVVQEDSQQSWQNQPQDDIEDNRTQKHHREKKTKPPREPRPSEKRKAEPQSIHRATKREEYREAQWYRLDNAAKIYPAISNKKRASVFRVAVVLCCEVDKDLLNAALRVTLVRFPAFAVRMRKGLFWYYFDHNDNTPEAVPERAPVCRPIDPSDTMGYLFRVSYYKKRISLEVFHAIADGTGAMAFLKTLTHQYLRLSGYDIPSDGTILHCDEIPSVFEYEDSFGIHYDSTAKGSWAEEKAYQIVGTQKPPGSVSVVHGMLSVSRLIEITKAAGATVTEYLTALLLYAIYATRLTGRGSQLPVKVSVPVNLRRFYSSRTLRNFSSYINVGMKFSRLSISFEQVLDSVRNQLRSEAQSDKLMNRISVNVNAEKKFFMRIAPLLLKNLVLRTAGNMFGDKLITTTLSNLGIVEVPEQMKPYIDRFEFVLGAPAINMINCTACTFDDKLVVSFTRVMEETDLERYFFRFLTSKGLDIVVDTN